MRWVLPLSGKANTSVGESREIGYSKWDGGCIASKCCISGHRNREPTWNLVSSHSFHHYCNHFIRGWNGITLSLKLWWKKRNFILSNWWSSSCVYKSRIFWIADGRVNMSDRNLVLPHPWFINLLNGFGTKGNVHWCLKWKCYIKDVLFFNIYTYYDYGSWSNFTQLPSIIWRFYYHRVLCISFIPERICKPQLPLCGKHRYSCSLGKTF